jgi:hypothetical protein
MTHHSLAEVRACLEETADRLCGEQATPGARFDQLESLAINTLDSQYMNYRDGELQAYLTTWLNLQSLELGLTDPKDFENHF